MDYNISQDRRIAVLIDADNISYRYIGYMMSEIAKYGAPTYKRIYGDWTQPGLNSWKGLLLEHSITPIQQYSYTYGKNATDSALIIDAMDILYSGNVEGFCIVSSDSDFTRLATRLRESGKYVLGMGEEKTPTPFIASCDKFIYLEVLVPEEKKGVPHKNGERGKILNNNQRQMKTISAIRPVICALVDELADDDGWAFLGEVGAVLGKRQPDFDPRNYGYQKLGKLIESLKDFEIDYRSTSNPNAKLIYLRHK